MQIERWAFYGCLFGPTFASDFAVLLWDNTRIPAAKEGVTRERGPQSTLSVSALTR
jgi:hypothetical protein